MTEKVDFDLSLFQIQRNAEKGAHSIDIDKTVSAYASDKDTGSFHLNTE
ncbi:hypothetical protein ACN6KF_002352 [Labrys sp. La1]